MFYGDVKFDVIGFMKLGPATVAMAILARLGVNIAANIGFQYAAEMLPTVVRAQGVSLIHIIGYFAHIIGPYVIYLVMKRLSVIIIFLIPEINIENILFFLVGFVIIFSVNQIIFFRRKI